MRPLSIAVLSVTVVTSSTVLAQGTEARTEPEHKPGWELLVSSGIIAPTGVQRAAVQQGKLTTTQVSYVVRPTLALTAALGWARTRDIATVGDPKLDAFTYDVGAELRAPRLIGGKSINFSPFAGAGAGGRTYNYRSITADATHNAAAYGTVGGELGVGRIRLRVEARDYVTVFKPLDGDGSSRTGNDVALMAGLRFVRR